MVLLALVGIGVLLYPSSARWFSDRSHAAVVSGYAKAVESMLPADKQRALAAAHAYNDHLPPGPLRDPYGAGAAAPTVDAAYRAYLDTLDVGAGGVIGYVSAPSIGLSLPIYHGTAAETLDRGVGHLYGTALPVGGAGTHSVLTAHSGLVNATMFTDIDKLRDGDEFSVTVLDQTITYRVDRIRTVLPDQTDSLRPVAGKDLLTLVTCAPIGVNTHRLLVEGVRVPDADTASARRSIVGRAGGPGFPGWLVEALGAALLIVVATRRLGDTSAPRRRGSAP